MFEVLRQRLSEFREKVSGAFEGRDGEEKHGTTAAEGCLPRQAERGLGTTALHPGAAGPRKLEARGSVAGAVKGAVTGKRVVTEKELASFLEELELALLEGDVELETAREICERVKDELVGKEVAGREDFSRALKAELRKVLLALMETREMDFLSVVAERKPCVIVLLGPNGAGKTTTMAKLTRWLNERGKKVVWAAADTFRAASIEQLEEHARKLGVRVVKHKYGADPAAVAFDAVKAAEADHVDAVLVDTAGRQETNRNLLEELGKIVRVARPRLKLFVGEAYAGQALLRQAREFAATLGVDGFVLTKLDADAKGGTAISLLRQLKKPILFVGVGQRYSDLEEFSPEYIVDRILA